MSALLVVEDDLILNEFIIQECCSILNLSLDLITSAKTFAESIACIQKAPYQALILDLNLPDGTGVDIALRFLSANPTGVVLIVTGQIDHYHLPARIIPSLVAILNKSDGLQPLRQALWSLKSLTFSDYSIADIRQLSPRQLQMLRLIGQGRDTAEIAEIMGISLATAQTHRRKITGRLKVRGSQLFNLARSLPCDDLIS